MVVCLERGGADLHMDQLMPLPLTVSCFSKIQIGFNFLVPAHTGSPTQMAIKWVCFDGPEELPVTKRRASRHCKKHKVLTQRQAQPHCFIYHHTSEGRVIASFVSDLQCHYIHSVQKKIAQHFLTTIS